MSIKIYIDSKSGAKNIDISRQKTNESNLEEAKRLWNRVIEIDEKEFNRFEDFRSDDRDLQILVTHTIPSRIEKNYIHYNLNSSEDISWVSIKRMATEYLNASRWLQINFCKDSTRQTVDENVQRAMLNFHLNDLDYEFVKCKPSKTLYGGKLLSRKEYLKLDPRKTRKDIDTFGSKQNKKIWIFQKYAKVSGGHQDNVITETQHFLQDADDFVSKNNSNNFFIAQLDGEFIERMLGGLRQHISSGSNVYVGNSEEVIKWIRET